MSDTASQQWVSKDFIPLNRCFDIYQQFHRPYYYNYSKHLGIYKNREN